MRTKAPPKRVLAFKVKQRDYKALKGLVRKWLENKGYKLYSKNKTHT